MTLYNKSRFPYELIISSCPVYTFPDTRDSAWNMVRANCTWAIGRKVGSYLRLRRLSGFVLQDIIGLNIGGDTFAPEEKIPLHRKKRYLCTGRDTFAPEERIPLHRDLGNVLIRKGYIGFVGVFNFAALYRFLECRGNDYGALSGVHVVHNML